MTTSAVTMAPRPQDVALAERLESHGWTETPSGCWEWNSYCDARGYGAVSYRGERLWAHRAAHLAWIGPLAEGEVVRHRVCDNPPCINPAHLLKGTQSQNLADMVEHGRHASQSRTTCARGHEWTPENTLQTERQRVCRQCKRDRARTYRNSERGRKVRNAQQRRSYAQKHAA